MNTEHPTAESKSPLWKTAALYLVKIFHLLCSILVLVGPYVTNNVFYLSLLVLYCAGAYFFWYTLGYCLCTSLEEYLGEPPATYSDGMKKSFMTTYLCQFGISESIVSNMFITIPAISVLVCMYKINVNYYKAVTFIPNVQVLDT